LSRECARRNAGECTARMIGPGGPCDVGARGPDAG